MMHQITPRINMLHAHEMQIEPLAKKRRQHGDKNQPQRLFGAQRRFQAATGSLKCCLRGSVAAMTTLTDFWLKPLKPPWRWRFSKWLPRAPSFMNWSNCWRVIKPSESRG